MNLCNDESTVGQVVGGLQSGGGSVTKCHAESHQILEDNDLFKNNEMQR